MAVRGVTNFGIHTTDGDIRNQVQLLGLEKYIPLHICMEIVLQK